MSTKTLRVLVAPLDWGLGHATRCIPLIQHLQDLGHTVIIAASGHSMDLLKSRFPALEAHEIPAYAVQYSRGRYQLPKILSQLPRLVGIIRAEHRWLRQMASTLKLDAVIADNRYGLWQPDLPTVIICHQLGPLLRLRPSLPEQMLAWLHRYFLERFDSVWVPDHIDWQLAGRMAHRRLKPRTLTFLGPLSRFTALPLPSKPVSESGRSLVILSGPEPQRTLLESKICQQFRLHPHSRMVLVRGLPGDRDVQSDLPDLKGLTVYPFLDEQLLMQEMAQADLIISRSGYSSLMDYAALGVKRLLLIPTPGQTEQAYLAAIWQENKWAMVQSQANLDFLRIDWDFKGQLPRLDSSFKAFHQPLEAWTKKIAS